MRAASPAQIRTLALQPSQSTNHMPWLLWSAIRDVAACRPPPLIVVVKLQLQGNLLTTRTLHPIRQPSQTLADISEVRAVLIGYEQITLELIERAEAAIADRSSDVGTATSSPILLILARMYNCAPDGPFTALNLTPGL